MFSPPLALPGGGEKCRSSGWPLVVAQTVFCLFCVRAPLDQPSFFVGTGPRPQISFLSVQDHDKILNLIDLSVSTF